MSDYSEFVNKKAILVRTEEGKTEAVEVEGTIQAASELGVLIKPKGRTKLELVPASEIEDVRHVIEKPKALTARVLKIVEFGGARNHLLERHGYTLKAINELNEQEALDAHDKINHIDADLGHTHEDKRDPAAAETSTDAEGDTATV